MFLRRVKRLRNDFAVAFTSIFNIETKPTSKSQHHNCYIYHISIWNFYITHYDFFYINIKIRLFTAPIIYISWSALSYLRRSTYPLFISQLVTITHATYAALYFCWESLSKISTTEESIGESEVIRSKTTW